MKKISLLMEVTYQTNEPTTHISEHELAVLHMTLFMMVPKDRQDADCFKQSVRILARKLAKIHEKAEFTTAVYN